MARVGYIWGCSSRGSSVAVSRREMVCAPLCRAQAEIAWGVAKTVSVGLACRSDGLTSRGRRVPRAGLEPTLDRFSATITYGCMS